MSKKDGVVIASRALSVFLVVWALTEISYLPEYLHSYRYYPNAVSGSIGYVQYMQHYHLLRICFLITRTVGYSLMARWLYKAGPEVEEVFLPGLSGEGTMKN